MSVFICGTDTNIGKTITAAHLMRQFGTQQNLYYWKPVQTGQEDDDSHVVRNLAQLSDDRILPKLYHFSRPLSPHYAAELDGETLDTEYLFEQTQVYLQKYNLVIEGAGGLMVPLNRKTTWLDFLKRISIPVILVARSGLGTINHSLLTIRALRDANIAIMGIVFCGPENQDNRDTVCQMGEIPCLAGFEYTGAARLDSCFSAGLQL